ncbi:hypothetical protein BpHYR1_013257, partial [Brachionus plicatilis]
MKKKLYKFALENGYEGVEDFLLIKEFLIINKSRNDLTELMNLFTKIESINLHFEISKRQREAYNSMRLNEDYIFIEMDWKQKIMIGLSPRQPSNEYRNQLSRTVFGFGVYYKINNFVECMNIDLVSGLQNTENASEVVKNFRFLKNLDVFKKIERKKYIIWADTGTHFRCSELIDYLFQELSKENIKVCLNFFVEKHGKNSRDQHFTAVTNFVNQESFVKKLSCSQDIVDAINKNQLISNIYRHKIKKLAPVITYAYVVDTATLETRHSYRKVKNITITNNMHYPLDSQLIEKSVIEPKLPNIIRKTNKLKKNIRSLQTNIDSRIDKSQELSMIVTNLEQSLNSTDSYWCTEKCNQCNANFVEKFKECNFFDTIMDLFKGRYRSNLVCEEIGFTSTIFEDFIEINLAVNGKKDVSEALLELRKRPQANTMPTWNPITYVYTCMQYITQLIYTKQVIDDELNRSKYGKKVPPTLNENKFRFIIQLLDQVNTYYYNQSYFQYIWNLTVTIFIFKILWSVLPMAVTWIVNWLKKKPTTQLQYVRQELKITPTKFTTNQDFNVWLKGFERYAKNVADKTNALLSLMEETCIEQLEQRLLIRNPNATYEEIIKISSKLFGRNPIYNDPLMEFVHRTQLQNETIFQFMF